MKDKLPDSLPMLLTALVVVVSAGCGDELTNKDRVTLTTSDGVEVEYSEMRCIFRHTTGIGVHTELQLQWLSSPDTLAFATYLEEVTPATPFRASAGEMVPFRFEVVLNDALYDGSLSNGEVTVELDSLPDPSTLTDGQVVPLNGALLTEEFILNDRSPRVGSLQVAAGRIPFTCSNEFSVAEALNGGDF